MATGHGVLGIHFIPSDGYHWAEFLQQKLNEDGYNIKSMLLDLTSTSHSHFYETNVLLVSPDFFSLQNLDALHRINPQRAIMVLLGTSASDIQTFLSQKYPAMLKITFFETQATEDCVRALLIGIIKLYEHVHEASDEETEKDVYDILPPPTPKPSTGASINNIHKVAVSFDNNIREVFIFCDRKGSDEIQIELLNPHGQIKAIHENKAIYRFSIDAELAKTNPKFIAKDGQLTIGSGQVVIPESQGVKPESQNKPTRSKLDILQEILGEEKDPVCLMCQALNIEERTREALDMNLARKCQSLEPLRKFDGGFFDNIGRRSSGPEAADFKDGKFEYIFGHPEQILKKEVCTIFKQKSWENVSHIVVDEAHCVVQWGHDFRPDFRNISKLRAILPQAKILALTATATPKMRKEIQQQLCMKDVFSLSGPVDRPNIKLIVQKRLPLTGGKTTAEGSYQDVLNPYIEELCSQIWNVPKTIVYSKLKWCGVGYDMVSQAARLEDNTDEILSAVSQFHAPCTDEMKKNIAQNMADTHGSIKLLFATQAYGMGTDAPDVERVCHIGPPSSLECYLQEIGRAGRDGRQSSAYMHYNMSDIATNTIVQPEVREFCLLKTCRRKFLSQYFETKVDLDSILKHNCCDVCEKECECDHCLVSEVEKCEVIDNCQCADEPDCTQLKEMLESYFNAENDQINMLNQQLVTGLTQTLCDKIVLNYKDIKCEEDIQGLFPYVHLKQHYLSNILLIVQTLN